MLNITYHFFLNNQYFLILLFHVKIKEKELGNIVDLEKTKEKYENIIFKTKKDTPLRFEINQVYDSGSNYWEYFEIKATHVDSDMEAGYLKLAVLSKDNFDKYFGTILKFADAQKGMHLNIVDKPEADLIRFQRRGVNLNAEKTDPETLEGKKHIIRKLVWNSEELVNSLKDEKEINNQFKKSLKDLERKIGESYQGFKDYHLEKPEVHYVDIKEEYRREGIATMLYDIGVELLGKNGYKLYQSTTQTTEAELFWGSRKDAKKNKNEKRSFISSESAVVEKKKKRRLKP